MLLSYTTKLNRQEPSKVIGKNFNLLSTRSTVITTYVLEEGQSTSNP
jgi:hypothetical protein